MIQLSLMYTHIIISFHMQSQLSSNIQSIVNNPMIGFVGNSVKETFIGKFEVSGILGKIFTPELRAYFDVDTITVRNKIMKLLWPFKTYEFDDQIKKLELYIPIVSLVTLIMFSTLLEGIIQKSFSPNISRRTIWILIFSCVQISLAKCTQNAISNLNISILYRFVSMSAVTIILVLTTVAFPWLRVLGFVYVLVVDTYYCKIQLSNCARERFKEEGLGSKIALAVHVVSSIAIMLLCDII